MTRNILENVPLEVPNRIEVKTDVTADGNIDQRVIAKFPSGGELSMMRNILRLQDEGIRDALIKLGWTPPTLINKDQV